MPKTAAVARAVAEIKRTFDEYAVHILREDGDGGAFVIVEGLELGPLYQQPTTWLGAHLDFQYPYSDVYPHYVRGDLARVDGRSLGDGTSPATWEGRSAVQLSRRSNRREAATDRADLKYLKVIEWLRTHP